MTDILTDILIIIGAIAVAVGVGLFDWRLALVWAGLLCMAVGLSRLRGR